MYFAVAVKCNWSEAPEDWSDHFAQHGLKAVFGITGGWCCQSERPAEQLTGLPPWIKECTALPAGVLNPPAILEAGHEYRIYFYTREAKDLFTSCMQALGAPWTEQSSQVAVLSLETHAGCLCAPIQDHFALNPFAVVTASRPCGSKKFGQPARQ